MAKNAGGFPIIPFDAERFIQKITRSKTIVHAVLVGLLAGLFIVAFKASIFTVETFVHDASKDFSTIGKLLFFPVIGAIGGLISGLLVYKIAPEAAGSGIPFVKLTLARVGRGIRIRGSLVKFLAGVIAIGTGMSLGKEGPSVHLGAGAGKMVSKLFNITGTDKDKLISAGAGSAVGAIFNTPIAATVFVLEELTHVFSSAVLFPVLIATIVAAETNRIFFGSAPTFNISLDDGLFTLQGVPALLLLGVIMGLLGVLFAKSLVSSLKIFAKFHKIKPWYKTALAGFVAGIFILFLPQITGCNGVYIEQLIQGKFLFLIVIAILVGKFLLTAFCYGSGAAGGIFMPIMMVGSFAGYAVGLIMNTYLNIDVNPAFFALLGMGAFFSAVVRAPITSIVIVFELTGSYENILPIMFCAAIADLVAERLDSHPIYSTLILRQGLDNQKAALLSNLKVKDYMVSDVETVKASYTLNKCLKKIQNTLHCGFPVVSDENELLGIITKSDTEDAAIQGVPDYQTISEIMNPNPHVIHEEDSLYNALLELHMNLTNWLVVVDEMNNVKGILTRHDIKIAAHRKAQKIQQQREAPATA